MVLKMKCSTSHECCVFRAKQDSNFNMWYIYVVLTCRNEGATLYICRFQMHSLSVTINRSPHFNGLVLRIIFIYTYVYHDLIS